MRIIAISFLAFLVLATPASGQAASSKEITGLVVSVIDGDTIKLLTSKKELIKIRLAEIDAPEKKQPYGMTSKKALSDLCYNQTLRAVVIDQDRYGRSVARLYKDDIDINAEMLRKGAAWVYPRYSHELIFPKLQEAAQKEKIGLWALQTDQRIPPWEWRKLHR